MRTSALLLQLGAICVLSLLATPGGRAQTTTETPAATSASSTTTDELSQAELLKLYLQVRDQLHATQLAAANSRAETEATMRAQTAAIVEKLDAIKAAMEAERQRAQVEELRAAAERERQQIEAARSNRMVLWVAVGFGALGLMAMLFMPLVQLRTINRIVEVAGQRPPPAPPGLLPEPGPLSPINDVTRANQRLMAVIERMEKRIFELEHTAVQPVPESAPEAKSSNGSENNGSQKSGTENDASDQKAIINVLLGKGKFLMSTNKVRDAVACYDEILKIDANHAEALVKKGAALERLQQDDAAIRCYDRAIEVNSGMTLAYLSKAGLCNRLGRYDEAMECYELALQSEEDQSKN